MQKCENSLGKQESPQGSQGGSVPSSSSNGAKLPKLHIKRFAGDPKNWQTFWDSFSSVVHKNASLSNVDKFNYLRSLLDGPALNSIRGKLSSIQFSWSHVLRMESRVVDDTPQGDLDRL